MIRVSTTAITLIALVACTAPADQVAHGPLGKADGLNGDEYPITLERSTSYQVAKVFALKTMDQLDVCFEAYKAEHNPNAKLITQSVIDQLQNDWPSGSCHDAFDLKQTLRDVLEAEGRVQAYPEDFEEWMVPWANQQLEVSVVDGFVTFADLNLRFFDALIATREANAIAREKDPEGIDLVVLREQWKDVQSDTTLDREFYNSVLLDPSKLDTQELFDQMRGAFPLSSLTLSSSGHTAIDDFWDSVEGPDGDPAFAPIANALAEPSVKKRFYFEGGGSSPFAWSRNVLILVDDDGQAFGVMMGYSE